MEINSFGDIMVSRKTHKRIAIIIFVVLAYNIYSKGVSLDFKLLPVYFLLLIFGARLPDLIEPARNQHHRRFFHSFFLLAVLSISIYKVYTNVLSGSLDNTLTASLFFFNVGYASHLLFDFLTYKGLPYTGL